MNKNNAVRRWLVMAGLAVVAAAGAVHAKDSAAVSRIWLAEVTPAQDQAFREGIKTYIGCLHQHGARQTVWAWSAQTGDAGRYVFEVGPGPGPAWISWTQPTRIAIPCSSPTSCRTAASG